jgi:hypothetical protein
MPLRPADRPEDLLKRSPISSRGAVHAVSHDFDGFVRRRQCGLVASHYRPWGSPGFGPINDVSAAARPFPQALYPSEVFPPGEVGVVTVPLLGRSPNALPLSWLALFVLQHDRNRVVLRKKPPPQGCPSQESVARQPCCHCWSARSSLGLSSTSSFHSSTRRRWCASKCSPPVRGPTETGTLQTMTPPKRTHRTDELVALEPFHRRSCSRSRRRDDAGSRDRTHGFPCAPPMPKHRPGAAAFQGPPLPMGAVTCGDEPPVSVGALAEASRRAEAFRHRVSSLTSP